MSAGSLRVLAIESSCDETSIALIEDGRRVRSNVTASQVALHAATGGVVPEVAARAHLRWILPVLDQARDGVDWQEIDAIAVTSGPGLLGSLLVGVAVAKTLAWVHDRPLVPVNHLEGHLYAAWLGDPETGWEPPEFPLVALIVSGGHTFLVAMRDHLSYEPLGSTIDDAAGEAFDKVGRLLGLPYPGGPAVMGAAAAAVRKDVVFPRAWLDDSFDFSFSGLKTAVRRVVEEERHRAGLDPADEAARLPGPIVAELAYGFQESVVEVLVTKTLRAAQEVGARSIVLGGGVASNAVLRERLRARADERGVRLVVPPPALCTDNGAMIGAAGTRRFLAGERAGLGLGARATWPIGTPWTAIGAPSPKEAAKAARKEARAAERRAAAEKAAAKAEAAKAEAGKGRAR